MIWIILFYLVVPFALSAAVLRLIRRYGAATAPADIRRQLSADPPAKGSFRVLRLEGRLGAPDAALAKIGDCEEQDDAVDSAYQAREALPGRSYLVVNDRGEILREIS